MSKIWLVVILLAVIYSCKKDDDNVIPVPTSQPSFTLNISHESDGVGLLFDTLIFTNDVGSHYSVSRLWYYLSQVGLIKPDSTTLLLKDYLFVDASNATTMKLIVNGIPDGNYLGMKFNIGLDSALNVANGLPLTIQNLNMEWPVQMGGGYHFMKFEGHASDSTGDYGFAMHLGLNPYLVRCSIWQPIQIAQSNNNLNLVMNINEWFRNPEVYDFNVDGNYSMGVMAAMVKLKNNGSDVFFIQ